MKKTNTKKSNASPANNTKLPKIDKNNKSPAETSKSPKNAKIEVAKTKKVDNQANIKTSTNIENKELMAKKMEELKEKKKKRLEKEKKE